MRRKYPYAATLLALVAAVLSLTLTYAQQFPTLQPLKGSRSVTYFIDEGLPGAGYKAGDRQLAEWALKAWERNLGSLRFASSNEANAQVRVYWVPAGDGRFGEMRSFELRGQPAAAVFIRPDTEELDLEMARMAREDSLMRDTIVYLTCLHELGHALGLGHTSNFADVMYYFGFGGDIRVYFTRYRTQLTNREDIAKVSGLSSQDLQRIAGLYNH